MPVQQVPQLNLSPIAQRQLNWQLKYQRPLLAPLLPLPPRQRKLCQHYGKKGTLKVYRWKLGTLERSKVKT